LAAGQRAEAALVIENAKLVRVPDDGLVGELPQAGDAAFAGFASLQRARRGIGLTVFEIGRCGEGEKGRCG
jgi:hypothetical protein